MSEPTFPESLFSAILDACRTPDGTLPDILGRLPAAAKAELVSAADILRSEPESQGLQQHLRIKLADHSQSVQMVLGEGGIAASQIGFVIQLHGDASSTPAGRRASALAAYREWVLGSDWNWVRLAGFSARSSKRDSDRSAEAPTVRDVYISLATGTAAGKAKGKQDREEGALREGVERGESLSALAAVARDARCVLLGKPGGGKSMFLRYLAGCLAAAEGNKLAEWPESLRAHLPVYVEVRELAARLPSEGTATWAELVAGVMPEEHRALVAGEAKAGRVLLLADGFDEIASPARRRILRDLLGDWLRRHPGCRAVVACRVAAYRTACSQSDEWRFNKKAWPVHELQGFDSRRIRQFIRGWYADRHRRGVCGSEWHRMVADLDRAVKRREIGDMASTPLLLTLIACVHGHELILPRERAALYEKIVELLLFEWDELRTRTDGTAAPGVTGLLEEINATPKVLVEALAALAWRVHAASAGSGAEKVGDFTGEELRAAILGIHRHPGEESAHLWAERLYRHLSSRAGLVHEIDTGRFAFPHRTFREYLAARHLVNPGRCLQTGWKGFSAEALALVKTPDGRVHWRVVLQLAAGRAVDQSIELGGTVALAAHLAPSRPRKKTQPALEDRRCLRLAGELLAEMGTHSVDTQPGGPELWDRVIESMEGQLNSPSLPAAERALSGMVLGQMGDLRAGVGTEREQAERTAREAARIARQPGRRAGRKSGTVSPARTAGSDPEAARVILPVFAWSQEIPADPFPMGNDKPEAEYDDEMPRFTCTRLSQPFRLSIYPVTVAQFQCFIDGGGYEPDGLARWWTAVGRAWAKDQDITGPANFDEAFQTPNHPRVGVSWFEAVAFCRWYNDTVPAGQSRIALPTEAQWECAARHGSECRRYPWGGDWQKESPQRHNNMNASGIGHTSAVGLFPAGAAACGALDMSGNVWEWCRTAWRDNFEDYNNQADESEDDSTSNIPGRVLRGGSWFFDVPGNMRASFRDWFHPHGRSDRRWFSVGGVAPVLNLWTLMPLFSEALLYLNPLPNNTGVRGEAPGKIFVISRP